MPRIQRLSGQEILDSRGQPTVLATCVLDNAISASASVPSGASTGKAETFQLRDNDPARYRGLGCLAAAKNISEELNSVLAGREFVDQAALDGTLIEIDGTENKSRLGGNAILAVSMAFARNAARQQRIPLFRYFENMLPARTQAPSAAGGLPRLTINLFSGGKHAGEQVAIQDVLMIPISAESVDEALVAADNVYRAAAALVFSRYNMRALTADEGGLAPQFRSTDEMFQLAVEAIEKAGYRPGEDFCLGVDCASSHFFHEGRYALDGQSLDGDDMIERIAQWLRQYPIVSVEDGLAEDDWEHWPRLRRALAGKALTLGDDLLCTNPGRITRAVAAQACDALLLKVNQVGTLTEALSAYKQARDAGWAVALSVRSGETEDDWAADLATGWRADQFKPGSIRGSERLAKYNRLLEIAAQTGARLGSWPLVAGN